MPLNFGSEGHLSDLYRDVGTFLLEQKPILRKRACNYLSFESRPTSLNPRPFPPVLEIMFVLLYNTWCSLTALKSNLFIEISAVRHIVCDVFTKVHLVLMLVLMSSMSSLEITVT